MCSVKFRNCAVIRICLIPLRDGFGYRSAQSHTRTIQASVLFRLYSQSHFQTARVTLSVLRRAHHLNRPHQYRVVSVSTFRVIILLPAPSA